ncbi:MAG: methionyl-tRNA formyltransferase [Pseudomonadota bacterium]
MKILFMGSGAFSIPALEVILESGHECLGVVAQPDKPAGRGQKVTACPVAIFAREHNLKLLQPNKLSETKEEITKLSPEVIIVAAYGKFLPQWLLDLSPKGCFNIHPSLLPLYRGAAPINWAIVNGDDFTGVTIFKIEERMDAGDILTWCKTDIDSCETAHMLHDRLALMGAELLLQTLKKIENNDLELEVQDESLVTFAPKLQKGDGLINWKRSATAVYNQVRGMLPWPVAFTHLDGKVIKIFEAAPHDEESGKTPGTVVHSNDQLSVACGKGKLYILELQMEGGKRMSAIDFLRGHKVDVGMTFN